VVQWVLNPRRNVSEHFGFKLGRLSADLNVSRLYGFVCGFERIAHRDQMKGCVWDLLKTRGVAAMHKQQRAKGTKGLKLVDPVAWIQQIGLRLRCEGYSLRLLPSACAPPHFIKTGGNPVAIWY